MGRVVQWGRESGATPAALQSWQQVYDALYSTRSIIASKTLGVATEGNIMSTTTHQLGDFIAYPTNRVVGTIADARSARAAIEALLQAGVEREDIDVLHGEGGLHRLDLSGEEHGFLAQFQRTLIRLAGPIEEAAHLRHHVEDVREGRFVIMVLAKSQDRRDVVAGVLNTYGAEFVGFYGRWAWQSMPDAHIESAQPSDVEADRGRTYETELDGVRFRLHFDFRSEAVDATITNPDGTVQHAKGLLRRTR